MCWLVDELNKTKQQMATMHLPLQTQATMVNLVCVQELKGKYYWPYLLGMLQDPNWHYI